MKILYFYQYFNTPKGSYNPRVFEFTRRWVEAGHDVTVVTSWFDRSDLKPSGFLSDVTIRGIHVKVVNIGLSNKHGFFRRLYTFIAYALMACWYALILPSDVVVASSGPISVGLPGLAARFLRRRPLVFEVRDLWPQGAIEMGYLTNPVVIRLARLFERLCYCAAERVVVLSEGMEQWIRETYGVGNIEVIPNAADNQLFEKLRDAPCALEAQGKKVVVYAGNMGPGDDCGQILDMAKCLCDEPGGQNVSVVLVGDGKQGAFLRERSRAENIPVQFIGFIAREKLIPILLRADCIVFATKDRPFYKTCSPNKLFDALAAGKPVVQTTGGWIKELLEREQCGLTAAPNDAAGFARSVLRIVGDADLSATMGANAKRLARAQFDRELLAAKMRDVLTAASTKGRRGVSATLSSQVRRT